MQRKAILIGAPGNLLSVDADDKLPGTIIDVKNMHSFLLSAAGGGWAHDEISVVIDPSRDALKTHLVGLKSVDYSYIHFAGHGRHVKRTNSTQVMLRPDVWVDAEEIVEAGASRSTLVIDACRKVLREAWSLEAGMESFSAKVASLSISQARYIFDRHLAQCPPASVQLYSCSLDELADEDSARGGFYTDELVKAAVGWAEDNATGTVLSVRAVHEAAAKKVSARTKDQQNPTAAYPRTSPYFPFAVR